MLFACFMMNGVTFFLWERELVFCFVVTCTVTEEKLVQSATTHPALFSLAFTCLLVMVLCRHVFGYFVLRQIRKRALTRAEAWEFSLDVTVPHYRSEAQIKDEIESALRAFNVKVEVVKVSKVYNLRDYARLISKVEQKRCVLRRMEGNGKSDSPLYRQEMAGVQSDIESLEAFVDRLSILEGEVLYFTKRAFVTFRSNLEREAAERILRRRVYFWQKSGPRYSCEHTAQPSSYLWKNFGVTKRYRFFIRLVSGFLCAVIVCITFLLLFGLKYAIKKSFLGKLSDTYYVLSNLLIYFIVSVTNFAIREAIVIFARLEFYTNRGKRLTSIVFKLALSHFINTALVLLFANLFAHQGGWFNALWDGNGTVATVTLDLLLEVIIYPLRELFGPITLHRILKRRSLTQQVKAGGKDNRVLQIDLNRAWEGQKFELDELYAHAFFVAATAFFLQPVIPYASLLAAIGILVEFAVQRWILIKLARRPHSPEIDFAAQMLFFLDICYFAYALGYVIFGQVLQVDHPWFSVSILGAALANLAFGAHGIKQGVRVKSRVENRELFYAEHWSSLAEDYDRLNPLTAGKRMREWIKSISITKGPQKDEDVQNILDAYNRLNREKLIDGLAPDVPREILWGDLSLPLPDLGAIVPLANDKKERAILLAKRIIPLWMRKAKGETSPQEVEASPLTLQSKTTLATATQPSEAEPDTTKSKKNKGCCCRKRKPKKETKVTSKPAISYEENGEQNPELGKGDSRNHQSVKGIVLTPPEREKEQYFQTPAPQVLLQAHGEYHKIPPPPSLDHRKQEEHYAVGNGSEVYPYSFTPPESIHAHQTVNALSKVGGRNLFKEKFSIVQKHYLH